MAQPETHLSPHRSLRFRLSMVTGLIILCAVLVTAFYAASVGFEREVTQKRDLLKGAASVYAAVLADPVSQGSRRDTAVALRGVRNLPGVTQADVRNADGTILTQFGSGAILLGRDDVADTKSIGSLWGAQQLRVETEIVKGGVRVGTLGLLADISDLREAVFTQLRATAVVALIAIILGVTIAQWLISHLTKPLRQLSSMMETFGSDQAGDLPSIKAGKDETGVLAEAFNTMTTSIKERDARITQHMETLEDTVTERTLDLSVARDNAEAANAAKSDFLATMSHEIRTPMNGMLVMAEMLSSANLPARHRRYAQIISRSGESLLNIINDILDLSKIESGKLDLELRPVSLDDLLCDVATLFWEKAREKQVTLATYVASDVPTQVLVDPTRLNQVISNLVNNALKFTETGCVTVRILNASTPGDQTAQISIEVEDTGIGIPEDKVDHIFEAFSQADQSTTRRFGGTGLGLAVCQRLADAMDGTIGVTSTVGEGSVFTLSFPAGVVTAALEADLAPLTVSLALEDVFVRAGLERSLADLGIAVAETNADVQIATSSAASTHSHTGCPVVVLTDIGDTEADALLQSGAAVDVLPNPFTRADLAALLARAGDNAFLGADALSHDTGKAAHPTFPGVHVLAADDNAVNREVLREALFTLGVKVDFAEDGQQAVEKSTQKSYDAIFMDGSMPVMDGFEATRTIREGEARDGTARTPIIALTAQVVGSGVQAWKEAGADDMVTKPFTLERIASALSDVVKPGTAEVSQPEAEAEPSAPPANSNALLDEATVADLAAMGARSGRDLQGKVWAMFCAKAPDGLAGLARAAEDNTDPNDLARKAHALKSMALSAGAKAFADQCQLIERAAKREANAETMRELLGDALSCLERTLAIMMPAAA